MRYNEFSMPSPEGERTYKAAEVKHILITRRGRVRLEVIGPDAMDVLRLIDLREPVQLPGVPLAIETGELRISLVDTNRNEATLDFTLFNDRLAQSRTPPFGYYKCSAYLRELLSTNIDDRL
jgi:hypothetical protein